MGAIGGQIRRMAERLLGPLVVRRRLPPTSGGAILCASARVGGLRYLLKPARLWDPELLGATGLLVEPGAVVWDVGANVGLFSKAAAFHAGPTGHVYAFEPDVDAADLLRRTSESPMDNEAPITIMSMAIGDSIGTVSFAIARRARSANSLTGFGSTQTGGVLVERVVPCTTLDGMLGQIKSPQVLKIDVEGAELLVLQGGTRVLASVRPWIHCEVTEERSGDVTKILGAHAYRIFDASTRRAQCLREVTRATYNSIAIPSEQVDRFLERARLVQTGRT